MHDDIAVLHFGIVPTTDHAPAMCRDLHADPRQEYLTILPAALAHRGDPDSPPHLCAVTGGTWASWGADEVERFDGTLHVSVEVPLMLDADGEPLPLTADDVNVVATYVRVFVLDPAADVARLLDFCIESGAEWSEGQRLRVLTKSDVLRVWDRPAEPDGTALTRADLSRERVRAEVVAERATVLADAVDATVRAWESGDARQEILSAERAAEDLRDLLPDKPTCARCGGPWGTDETCSTCTDDAAYPRPIDPAMVERPAECTDDPCYGHEDGSPLAL